MELQKDRENLKDIRAFAADESGVGVIELVLILVVLIGLVIILRSRSIHCWKTFSNRSTANPKRFTDEVQGGSDGLSHDDPGQYHDASFGSCGIGQRDGSQIVSADGGRFFYGFGDGAVPQGLWENYRILGLETGEKERLEQEFGDFFAPYAEAENWYPVTLVDTDRKDAVMLTEGQGAYFEQEILDYMKFGLIDMIWDSMDENGAREMLSQFKDAEGINGCSVRYEGHTREAVRVEAALEKINGRLEEQRQNWEQGKRCLDDLDGSGLIRRAESMIKILKSFLLW